MKLTTYIFLTFFVFSCNNQQRNTEIKTMTADTIKNVAKDNAITVTEEKIQEEYKNDFDILLPSEYRDWENKNPVNDLTKDWIELFIKDGKYYLGKADYTINRGYSECSGDSTKIINSKNNTILLINNDNLESGKISSLEIKKNKIWPNEKLTFNFGNEVYTLRAEGNVLSSDTVHTDNGDELYQKVENYKLYISSMNSAETLFLEQTSFNDTFVKILFIGDLDKDGKADFIFEANRDYEEERVILYMSSKAKKGEQIKKVSEVAIQFDC
jgi:hypothetical protein